jgi:hypothetical protein
LASPASLAAVRATRMTSPCTVAARPSGHVPRDIANIDIANIEITNIDINLDIMTVGPRTDNSLLAAPNGSLAFA